MILSHHVWLPPNTQTSGLEDGPVILRAKRSKKIQQLYEITVNLNQFQLRIYE